MKYTRQIALPEIGEVGQRKLAEAKVIVIGAGGLGCPALQYLVAAGVGTVGIADGDHVEESNLNRQVLHAQEDIGQPKVKVAITRLKSMNPDVNFKSFFKNVDDSNALEIIKDFDLVLDCTDRVDSRYIINDACIKLNKPFIFGAVYRYEGQFAVLNYNNGPSYRCLFPEDENSIKIPSCDEVGVLGAIPGLIGTSQAVEALKILIGIGEVLSGKLRVINILRNTDLIIEALRNEEMIEIARGRNWIKTIPPLKEILSEEFNHEASLASTIVVDVRERSETPRLQLSNLLENPISEGFDLDNYITAERIILVCQHGIRSWSVAHFLRQNGITAELMSLKGGIAAYYQLERA